MVEGESPGPIQSSVSPIVYSPDALLSVPVESFQNPETPITYTQLNQLRMQLRGVGVDDRLRLLRAGILPPSSVADFFTLTYFGREQYEQTNEVTSSVIKRRSERDTTAEVLQEQFATSPYQEQPPEAVEAAVEDLKNRGYKEFLDPDEEKMYRKADNQLTYLKGQLTLAAKAMHKLNHVQIEHIPGYKFRTRKIMEETVFGKDFIKGEIDPHLRREKIRLKRELAAHKRISEMLQQAQYQYDASLRPKPTPVSILEPKPSVQSEELPDETVKPEESRGQIVTPTKDKDISELRRELLTLAGLGGAWTVAAQIAPLVPGFLRRHGPEIAKVAAVTDEYGAFVESSKVVDALGHALVKEFPPPKEFPRRAEELTLITPEKHQVMPQTVAEVAATGAPIVAEGLRQLFLAGRFLPNKDIYWNIDSHPVFEQWANQLITQLAGTFDATQRIDELNRGKHRVSQTIIQPRDVAEEILTNIIGPTGQSELCRLCDQFEQQDRLALVAARGWYEKLYQLSNVQSTINFSPVIDRLAPYAAPSFSLMKGQQVSYLALDYLRSNLGAEWEGNRSVEWFANKIGDGSLGMVKVNGENISQLDLNNLPEGSTVVFDPRLISFVKNGLEENANGTLSLHTLFKWFDMRSIPEPWQIPGSPVGQEIPPVEDSNSFKISLDTKPSPPIYSTQPSAIAPRTSIGEQPVVQTAAVLSAGLTRRDLLKRALALSIAAKSVEVAASNSDAGASLSRSLLKSIEAWRPEYTNEFRKRTDALFRDHPFQFSTTITTSDGEVLRRFHPIRGKTEEGLDIKYSYQFDEDEEIPHFIKMALTATENKNFFDDEGVDPVAMAVSFGRNLTSAMTSGASTITQQLVRTLAYSEAELRSQQTDADARFRRKTIEIPLAILYENALEKKLGSKAAAKEFIMKQFLDSMYFGKNTIGIKAAAHAFFGKPIHRLTLAESASLVGLLQQPGTYSTDPKIAARRALRVISLMKDRKDELEILGEAYSISDKVLEDAQRILRSDQPLQWISSEQTDFGKADGTTWHFTEELLSQLSAEDRNRGLTLRSTLDGRIQKSAVSIIRNLVDSWKNKDKLPNLNAAMLIVDPTTGSIKAHVANTKDFFDPSAGPDHQKALHAEPRSAGSTLKPVLAAAAMRYAGMTGETMLDNSSYTYRDKKTTPSNFDEKVLPMKNVTLRQAIANSLNKPMVRLIGTVVGLEKFLHECSRLGMRSAENRLHHEPDNLDEGVVIGSIDARLIDLVKVYIPFFNSGKQVGLRYIESASNRGTVTQQPLSDNQQVVSPEVAEEIFSILSDSQARNPEFPASWLKRDLGIDEEVAFKTGTSTGYTDNWIVAFDKKTGLMIVTWVGNTDRSKLPENYFGANRAGMLAGNVIQNLRRLQKHEKHFDQPAKQFV